MVIVGCLLRFLLHLYLLPCIWCIITNIILIALAKLAIKSKIGRK